MTEDSAPVEAENQPEEMAVEELAKLVDESSDDPWENEAEGTAEPAPEPAPAPEGNDAIELTDQVVPPPPAELEEITLIDEVVEDDVLVSAATTAVGASAFAQLTGAMDLAMRLGGVDRTLEALVKELMRPMLRDWLEANLPAVVERLVQREIDKMSVKSGDD